MNVRLSKEQKVRVLNSTHIYDVMQQVLLRENKIRRNQEHFWVVGLSNDNTILFIELVGLGTINSVGANPPDVFRIGIYKSAVKMILVHNHPSGDLRISEDDMNFTDRMLKVGKIITIDVIDHLVISEESYVSMADKGIIRQLTESGAYEVVSREQKEMEELKHQIEKDQAIKAKSLDIARKMKEDGVDEDTIKKYTGLYLRDIRKL